MDIIVVAMFHVIILSSILVLKKMKLTMLKFKGLHGEGDLQL